MRSNQASASSMFTRRSVFTAAGIGVATIAGLPEPAGAAPMSDSEKANVQVVNAFCSAWPNRNVEQLISFFADNCAYRVTETQEPYKGRQAVTDRFKSMVDHIQSFDVIETFARGPMVFNERKDHFTGGALKMWHGVGVFFLKEGKIVEWYDYTIDVERR